MDALYSNLTLHLGIINNPRNDKKKELSPTNPYFIDSIEYMF